MVGAILVQGQHTITAIYRIMRPVIRGHVSTYHRVFSRASWSLWPLGRILTAAILHFLPPDEPVLVPMDDAMLPW
jgi:hypothetical protein